MTQREVLETGSTAYNTGNASQQVDRTPDDSPQGDTEITVERVFAEILGASGLPRSASLFDLGLDSVSVTLACAQLEQATGVRVRFTQLFRTRTIAQLAAWIDANRKNLNEEPGIPVWEGAALVAITPMQASTVPLDIVPKMAWWFDAEIDDEALAGAVNDIHRRHQALHAKYLTGPDLGLAELPADPGKAQFNLLPQEDTDAAADDALWRILRQPLRLSEGEIWRCAVVRSAESGRSQFGVAAHHAAFDGQSFAILSEELSAAYSARAAGTVPQWPGRVASLAEMAADYRHQLAAHDADAQRRYWRNEYDGLPSCYLPGRSDAPAPPGGPAADCSFRVSNTQLRIWEDYARASGMPASVGMAAVYVQALTRAGGPPDFGLMVGIANKAGEVIDRTITNRVGTILLRANGPSRSGPHLLARIRDTYYQAMAMKDILLDPKEVASVFSDPDSDGVILPGIPIMVYNSILTLSLGGVAGTFDPKLLGWKKSGPDLVLEVVPDSEGLSMHMVVRTDLYDASLADQLAQHFIDIINEGPERLELETAR